MKKIAAIFFVFAMLFGTVSFVAPTTTEATGGILFQELYRLYEKAKEKGKPAAEHEVVDDERTLPKKGPAMSSKDLVNKGELVQRRYYGPDGKADMDIDYTHHGNPKQHPKVPHRHDWDWSNKSNPRGDGY
ncbi:hypothetical protein [Brevibacillus brevis]|uniref:hypothetical protein n=1 Tax=Brevibacillus brevis TaxID=1393 RepID=UPI0037C73767